MPYELIIFTIFFAFAALEAVQSKLLFLPTERPEDKWIELICGLFLLAITQPSVIIASAYVTGWIAPEAKGMLADMPIWAGVALLLVFDDMAQYWWHRASHTFPWLYGLHRSHHNAEYMSIRIVYRNNILYYAFMPSLWLSGALIHLGLAPIYGGYIIVKLLVIYGAHSSTKWDAKLYDIKWLSPVMWLVERTISTPATHFAHHGKHAADPATNYKGNFGNLLFFWDVLFGTAKITRTYPKEYGVENLAPMSAGAQLIWPLVRDETTPYAETPPQEVPAAAE
ncbi:MULTISPECIES: sterol desaturase family protein [Kordiimonas]|mgnify:CR=1 FL=1|jgi:sterol desaturase/sphingolipid hydroxylase (fatty acid hydroxylase superfamily)|uniref:sterol desaturase family protein n=1 Tax=Kordiimonas TaxID=288021 RepID=UPI00258108DF|nr:sterol desaturase family protein [Kordiimonas sp. UBA4487]